MQDIQTYINQGIEMLVTYAPKVLLAIITLLIGLRIIKVVVNLIDSQMQKGSVDETLRPFLLSLIRWGLKIMLFISIASMVGIETTSFVAVLGAAGLAVGLALQGTLANFAGGALIMLFKPYRVGDVIEAQGHTGSVKEIQIFNTILTSPQNQKIIIPNGAISNGNIINYNTLGTRRVDMAVGVGYGADIRKAQEIILGILNSDERVLKDPAPFVGVSELADSSVNLVVRAHCQAADYWGIYFDNMLKMKEELDANNIEIPFPQVDVNLKK